MPAAWTKGMKGFFLEIPTDVVLGGGRSTSDSDTQSSIGALRCIYHRFHREDSWVVCVGRR